jgi:hypothetical protein
MSAKDHNQTFDLQKPDSATSDRPLRTNPELNAKRFGPSFMGREGQSIPDGETDGLGHALNRRIRCGGTHRNRCRRLCYEA